MIKVWEIQLIDNGSSCGSYLEEEKNLENTIDMLKDMEEGQAYLITAKEIGEVEFKNLPEFTGF